MHEPRRSNEALLSSLSAALKQESVLLANVITMLIEVEDRRLHLELASSSMFDFCRRRLGMSEGQTFRRLAAARLVRTFPSVLEAIRSRRIHLSSLVLLRDLFTRDNVDDLIAAASGKSKSAVKDLVARLAPKPDAPSRIRQLPTPHPRSAHPTAQPSANTSAAPSSPLLGSHPDTPRSLAVMDPSSAGPSPTASRTNTATVIPEPTGPRAPAPVLGMAAAASLSSLAAAPPRIPVRDQITASSETRHKVQFTVSTEVRQKLERAQDLMRHRNLDGDLSVIVERALDLLLTKLEKDRFALLSPKKETPPAHGPNQRSKSSAEHPGSNGGKSRTESPTTDAVEDRRGPHSRGAAPHASATSTGERSRTESPTTDGPRGGGVAAARVGSSIPAAARREVAVRDGERCTFESADGERCGERALIEIDHRHPRALGGSHDVSNLRLLCRAHNHFEAERIFGAAHVAARIRQRKRKRHQVERPEKPRAKPPTQPKLPFA